MIRIILKEIGFRRSNFCLTVSAIVVAVALLVTSTMISIASENETRVAMRDMGRNLRIVAKETDMIAFWNHGYSQHNMPETYIDQLVAQERFLYNHLIASLQKQITWNGLDVILTGLAPQTYPPGKPPPPMSFEIKPGDVYLGYFVAHHLELKKGDAIEIQGKKFNVASCLSESGSIDDIRIQCSLADAQSLLGLPGQINEIQALDCISCEVATPADPLALLRKEITQILPDTQVVHMTDKAKARTQQRRMIFQVFGYVIPVVILVCAAWIGVLAMINVRDRKQEIGIMRALGYESGRISSLFLGKAALAGMLGALLGFGLGTLVTLNYGADIFTLTAKKIEPLYSLLLWSLIGAPFFAALASFIPAMIAVAQDPAETLRES